MNSFDYTSEATEPTRAYHPQQNSGDLHGGVGRQLPNENQGDFRNMEPNYTSPQFFKTEDYYSNTDNQAMSSNRTNNDSYQEQSYPVFPAVAVETENSGDAETSKSKNILRQNAQPTGNSTRVQPGGKLLNYSSPRKPHPKAQQQPSTAQERTKLVNKRTGKNVNVPSPGTNEQYNPAQTDPFTHWYQMMSQYYSQFYPGYQMPQSQGASISAHPSTKSTQQTNRAQYRATSNSVLPPKPSFSANRQPPQMAPHMSAFASPNPYDYASYYYQYYYNTGQMWPPGMPFPGFDQQGRKTPKQFHVPHIRAWLSIPGILLQVRPNRPSDGDLPLVELIDLAELAHQAVAEATKRASEIGAVSELSRQGRDLSLTRDGFSSDAASGLDSPDQLSSFQAVGGADGEDAEEARAYGAIAAAWDRTEHTFYPGPLDRRTTLKADILAFLRDKLAEIQDRLPIDWESAALLITYLEWMVKNNGDVQPGDLVNLLLEGHNPHTEQYRSQDYVEPALTPVRQSAVAPCGSFDSLPGSGRPSGRQSPYVLAGSSQAMTPLQGTKAASECGAYMANSANAMRAAGRFAAQQTADLEGQMLDRFRELLMHGMTMKALEHACRVQLWGHAFALAKHLSPAVFDKVMEKFLTRAVSPTDPIITFYQISAGEIPQAVTNVACGRGADIGEWRPHLAMILAIKSAQPELAQSALERLGDGLLARRLVYAAHLCYLLMGPLYDRTTANRSQPAYRLPDKMWLVGVPAGDSQSPLTATTEAIQLTEIYEYTMKLADKNYHLPQLLPFKLVYATRLIDAGLLSGANRYLAAIGVELLSEADALDLFQTRAAPVPPVLYSLVENCLRLSEPLQSHPELDHLEVIPSGRFGRDPSSGTGAAWIGRLRELYQEMNRKLGRPSYHSVNLDVCNQSQSQPEPPVAHTPQFTSQTPVAAPSLNPEFQHTGGQPNWQSGPPVSGPTTRDGHVGGGTHVTRSPSQPFGGGVEARYPVDQPAAQPPSVPGKQEEPFVSSAHTTDSRNQWSPTDYHSIPPTTPTAEETHKFFQQQQQQPPPPQLQQQHSAHSPTSYDSHSRHAPNYPHTQGLIPSGPRSSTSDSQAGRSPQPPTPQPQQASASNFSFFTPTQFSPSATSATPTNLGAGAGGGGAEPTQAYDYFAHPQYQQQSGDMLQSRSRTVSGSSHGSMGGQHATNTASTHSSFTPANMMSSKAGGPYRSRHDSSTFSHQPDHTIKTGESHQRNVVKEEPAAAAEDDVKPRNGELDNQQQSKDSWISGWWDKLKRAGAKSAYLPDDKNPSIIWDDQLRQWIDVTNPEANNATPPPPPPAPSHPLVSAPDVNPPMGRPSNRPRYVNVLANQQTEGSAALRTEGGLIQPPLPPTMIRSPGDKQQG